MGFGSAKMFPAELQRITHNLYPVYISTSQPRGRVTTSPMSVASQTVDVSTSSTSLPNRNPRSCDACQIRKVRCRRDSELSIIDDLASQPCVVSFAMKALVAVALIDTTELRQVESAMYFYPNPQASGNTRSQTAQS